MTDVDTQTIKRMAMLARIAATEEEENFYAGELAKVFTFIDQLNQVDTKGVEPMISVGVDTLRLRDDVQNDGGYAEAVTANAPEKFMNFFVVPKVVE